MKSLFLRTAAIAAVAMLLPASPAHAIEVPGEPVLMHLKNHPDLQLTWSEDQGATLTAEGDAWTLRSVEAMEDLGAHLIVHEGSGACLSATPMPLLGAQVAPVELTDCDVATQWSVRFDTSAQQDYRIATPEGHFLGIESDSTAEEGSPVYVVDVPSSRHAQEWLFAAVPPEVTPPPEETTEPPAAPPKLPRTGADLVVGAVSAVAAIGAGVAMLLWRRRTLRTDW